MSNLAVVVLAAGHGTRMRSHTPKVLHRVAGRPLLDHVLSAVAPLNPERTLVVLGPDSPVADWLEARSGVEVVIQPERLGTGDAVRACAGVLAGFTGHVVVLFGDGPLIRTSTVQKVLDAHLKVRADATLLTAELDDPTGYGRVIRTDAGNIVRIVEEADASASEQAIREVSTGIWCFEAKSLFRSLDRITPDNAQGEYYLTDAAFIIASKGGKMYTTMADDPEETKGVNDRLQLAEAERALQRRMVEKLSAAGVTFEDPDTAYIEAGVEIGPDTVIRPSVYLRGETRVGSGCVVGPQVDATDSAIGEGSEVLFAVLRGAEVGPRCMIGPFAYLRPGTKLEVGVKIGTFVEINRSTIGAGSKVPHLSYIGDTEMGADVNIGAGTITGNYDGETETKSKTVIEDGVDTGSGSTIVAPVRLGRDAVTGAGSVVTKDVAPSEVVVGVPARPVRKRKPKKEENT